MKTIKLTFWAILIAVSGLWVIDESPLPDPLNYFSFRHIYVQYTGFVCIILFSLAMVLALRPRFLEQPLGGLDKMYRLHKWLGIGGLVFAVIHWWLAQGTKWMVAWGWLARPGGRQRGAAQNVGVEQWLHDWRGVAESVGEWAFYGAALLIVLALIKAFPYYRFRKTHKILAVAYLALAWHSLVLIEPGYWGQPLFWLTVLLLAAGAVAAVMILMGRVARRRQVPGVVRSVHYYPGIDVVEGSVEMAPGWPGHKPGQFAFVTSNQSEGAHPYTIASAWDDQTHSLTFIVKALGDWTGKLSEYLHEGLPVRVEGPYGCFDFEDAQPRQIWIGAGIGITPFVAAMKFRASHPQSMPVDLFHVTSDVDQEAIDKLKADAAAANVRLHLLVSPRDGRLTPQAIREAVPPWREASIWFCGPAGFGVALRQDFIQQGLAAERFHQELFDMR